LRSFTYSGTEMKYRVWTRGRGEDAEDFLEVTRTSRRAAEDDVRILRDICHKKAYIEEVDD